jgi:putative nucleotidyltransferase with HDIG domain
MGFWKKISPRRSQVRKNISAERFSRISRLANTDFLISILIWLLFVVLCTLILSIPQAGFIEVAPITAVVVLISLAGALYIHHYQKRITTNHARALVLVGLFILLLVTTKLGVLSTGQTLWATATAVTTAIIMTIAYDQRFAIGMSILYCLLACLAVVPMESQLSNFYLFLTMTAGATTCCFCLKEIRTRIKLLQVSTLAAIIVFLMAASLSLLSQKLNNADIIRDSALHAGVTLVVGVLIQGLLPLIEKAFRIATSMTLLDYSDANQRLLKRLHMEAPGTFSHSLLIGSIAEAAAEAIGRNGLLCRVGAYYHDIGKINKAGYFVENELGSASRHKELSPKMSHLIIVGHVKDGIEMAKEYGLPSVLRQFIETHHGTTLIEHFYNEAKKQTKGSKGKDVEAPSESEFRYPGPKPRTKEAAIVMLADTVEGAVRSLSEVTPTKIEAVVHNMSMKRLQDGQFDECDMSLRELSLIEASISKTLAAHYHGRIAYPKPPDEPPPTAFKPGQTEQKNN